MIERFCRLVRPKSGIYVVNSSTLASNADVQAWTAACGRQLAEHAAPAWRRKPVRVQYLPSADHAPRGSWVLAVLDDADQAGALGYHSVDRYGRVYGRVFLQPCLQYGVAPSTTLSHEILETFGDPTVDRWADTGRGYSVPVELCDAVEGGSYEIDGVLVSDFVYPAWFSRAPLHGPYNHLGTVTGPFLLDAGGYTVRRFPDGSEDQAYGRDADRGYIAAKRSALSRTTRRTKESR